MAVRGQGGQEGAFSWKHLGHNRALAEPKRSWQSSLFPNGEQKLNRRRAFDQTQWLPWQGRRWEGGCGRGCSLPAAGLAQLCSEQNSHKTHQPQAWAACLEAVVPMWLHLLLAWAPLSCCSALPSCLAEEELSNLSRGGHSSLLEEGCLPLVRAAAPLWRSCWGKWITQSKTNQVICGQSELGTLSCSLTNVVLPLCGGLDVPPWQMAPRAKGGFHELFTVKQRLNINP